MPHCIRLSDPPTASERLQLLAARLLRTPVAIMPTKCATSEEWLTIYFFNSAFVALAVMVGNVLFCSLAGYGLAKFRFPFRTLCFVLI